MDELISRKAAIEYLMTNMGWRDEDGYEVDDADDKRAIITDLINGIPAVEAAPVVHAYWRTVKDGSLECTNCFTQCPHDENYYGDIICNYETEYCPCCGAKMDGGQEEEHEED